MERAPRYDAVIVGARVAGAAAALLMARQGRRVLVLDEGERGGDTLSTHFIWPRGVRRLAEWGLLQRLLDVGTPPIRSVCFDPEPGLQFLGELESIALCPRRTVLDAMLVDAAEAAGAEFRHGVKVTSLEEAGGRVTGVRHDGGVEKADLVVGADGRRSTVAGLVGAAATQAEAPQTAGFYAYFDGLRVEHAEFCLRDGRLTYVWPTNHGQALVYVGTSPGGFDQLRAQTRDGGVRAGVVAPGLFERMAGATQATQPRGFANQGPLKRRRCGPGWALIGDAASFKDPTAGMGISEAFEDAAWLAGDGRTELERDQEAQRVYDFCVNAARLTPPPAPAAAAYRAAQADPAVARTLMRRLACDAGR